MRTPSVERFIYMMSVPEKALVRWEDLEPSISQKNDFSEGICAFVSDNPKPAGQNCDTRVYV
jgi:hypothetical protein